MQTTLNPDANLEPSATPLHKAPLRTARILDRAADLYRRAFGKQLLAAVVIYAIWAVLLFVLWQGFLMLLPRLNADSNNAIVTGIYAACIAIGATFLLWTLRRIALAIAAEAVANRSRLWPAITAGLAELFCDCLLLGAVGFALYMLEGLDGLARVALQPSWVLLLWLSPFAVIFFLWMAVKTMVIPIAMRDRRHFLAAMGRAIILVFKNRAFSTFLRVRCMEMILSALAIGGVFLAARECIGVPSAFGGLSPYIAPLWFLLLADMAVAPLAPFHALLPSACADVAVGVKSEDDIDDAAGFGARVAAGLFDLLMIGGGLLLLTLAIALPMIGPTLVFAMMAQVTVPVLLIFGVALILCVFILCALFEAMGGQTIGKRLFRIRVVSAEEDAITYGQAFLRGLVRVLDMVLIGGILIFFREDKARLGDMAAGTYVMHD